ncbi:MAG: site-2 protease family protein, partial [Hyphomicrobiaceae bacterium]
KLELGSIGGVPIFLDMFLVLILILFSYPYFTSGNTQMFSIGIVVIIGILVSILLHEVGHMLAARLFKVGLVGIEIGGLGGITHFSTSLPRSVIARVIIFLAGPAMNFLLWKIFDGLVIQAIHLGKPALLSAVAVLASINFYLMIFNLLPSFPLDGGQTLDTLLGPIIGPTWATRVVAALGLCVTALCIWYALPTNIWMLLVALALFQANWMALDTVNRFNRRR